MKLSNSARERVAHLIWSSYRGGNQCAASWVAGAHSGGPSRCRQQRNTKQTRAESQRQGGASESCCKFMGTRETWKKPLLMDSVNIWGYLLIHSQGKYAKKEKRRRPMLIFKLCSLCAESSISTRCMLISSASTSLAIPFCCSALQTKEK